MSQRNTNDSIEEVSTEEVPIGKAARTATANAAAEQPVSLAAAVETAASDSDVVDVVAPIVDDVLSTDLLAETDTASSGSSLMTDVVFRLPAHADIHEITLVGDFNNWSQAAHRMTRDGDSFEVTVPLQRGRRYRYRYLIDGQRWENDWNADEYVPNDYGGDDSVRIV